MTTRPPPFPTTPRRTALAAVAVCLMFAASLRAAEPDYTSLAGVKAAGFQKFIDDAKGQDYEPVYINGYDVGDHVEYAGVALKDPDKKPFESKFDMTDDEYQQFFNEMSKKGYRPTCVSGYHTKGGPRFAAVWVKDKNAHEWKAKHGQTQKEYEETLTAMSKDGLFPVCATAYQGPDGGVRYTSLFYKPKKGRKWENRHDLTADQLQDQLDKWKDQGFQLNHLHAYDSPDGLRFLAIARKEDKEIWDWQEHHGMSGDQYQKEFDKLAQDGFKPFCICGYREGGKVRFAAVWTKKK